jgi:endonuclease YncB( thermonuclease family)
MVVGCRLRLLLCVSVVSCAGGLGLAPSVQAQERLPATVTGVVDGDTVDAQVTGGPALAVQVIGIDAPEPGDCGAVEATDSMEELALGRSVTLVSDPIIEQFAPPGNRPLFYVDRDDGVDVGLEMVRAGWAEIWELSDFLRSSAYMATEQSAQRFQQGAWIRCGGDFHLNRGEELRRRRRSVLAFVRRYYRRLSNDQYVGAWRMLGARRRAQVRPFWRWKAGYRGSLSVSVVAARARLAGARRAVVSVRLRARDRDACSGATVRQRFAGNVIVAPRRDSWIIVKFQMRKTGGRTPRLSKSECAPSRPRSSPPSAPSVAATA